MTSVLELLANSNLDKTIVGSRILLQIWSDRRICIPLFNPPFSYANVVIFAHYKTLLCTFSAVETQTDQQPDDANAAIASYADNVSKYMFSICSAREHSNGVM